MIKLNHQALKDISGGADSFIIETVQIIEVPNSFSKKCLKALTAGYNDPKEWIYAAFNNCTIKELDQLEQFTESNPIDSFTLKGA